MEKTRLSLLIRALPLLGLYGCDIGPSSDDLVTSGGVVNKGILSQAIANVYKAGTEELVKKVYTEIDGTFALDDVSFTGTLYVEIKTTSQTLATCDGATGCGDYPGGLKQAGEYDGNLNGRIDFGDKYFYHDTDFILTAFIKPSDDSDTGQFAVTPLTHLAAEKIAQLGDLSLDKITVVNAQVAELFGLNGADITRVIPPDITNEEAMKKAAPSQQLYAALNAAVASAATSTNTSVSDVIGSLVTGFKEDGGLVGNSNDANKVTLASLQTLAKQVADVVEATFPSIDLMSVTDQIDEEIQEQLAKPADEVVIPSDNPVLKSDFDKDGISDEDELSVYGTDQYNPDTDDDGLLDGKEVELGTSPTNEDTDGDGMIDGIEVTFKLDPLRNDAQEDADGDGLTNIKEVVDEVKTDPFNKDTDEDGLTDFEEVVTYGTNPLTPDSDGDGLTDIDEINTHDTAPRVSDSDNDGMPDGWEVVFGLDPKSSVDALNDDDDDGLVNKYEYKLNTNPGEPDTDFNGVNDGDEDFDDDGIINIVELMNGLDPFFDDANLDADGDTITNTLELDNGSDLNVPNPIIEFVSDAQIYANASSGAIAMSITGDEFYSLASDLSDKSFLPSIDNTATADTNGQNDILIHDLTADTYELPVRQDSDGVSLFTDGYPELVDATSDGKKLLFVSDSIQVVSGDTATKDAYILDRISGVVTRIDNVPTGFGMTTFSGKISEDGNTVFITTAALDLENAAGVITDGNSTQDVYTYNVSTGNAQLISMDYASNPGTTSGDSYSDSEQMSADGRYVVFRSAATDIIPGDINVLEDIFFFDTQLNAISLVSNPNDSADDITYGSHSPQLSANGKGLTFLTRKDLPNLGVVPTNDQLYYYDSGTSQRYLVSQSYDGSNNNYGDAFVDALSVRISADGQYVLYKSNSTNLVPNDTNAVDDLFMWNRQTQTTHIVSQYGYGDVDDNGVLDFDDNPSSTHTNGLGVMGVVLSPDASTVYVLSNYGDEYSSLTNCIGAGNTCLYKIKTHIAQSDSDNDGLNDRQEMAMTSGVNSPDSDGDGLLDGHEVFTFKTSPINPDTDGDGVWDGTESTAGTDPLDPASN